MTECLALLRGINVGRAKRVAMAELRGLFVGLGHENVRTLLNSGNVLFCCARPNTAKLALAIQAAQPSSLVPLRTLLKEASAPEALAIGSGAAYLWCATGVLDGKLSQVFARRAGQTVTTRNWATVLKLLAASTEDGAGRRSPPAGSIATP